MNIIISADVDGANVLMAWPVSERNGWKLAAHLTAALGDPDVRMGDIGEPVRHIELEPLPEHAPAEPAPSTPAPERTPEKEPVPA